MNSGKQQQLYDELRDGYLKSINEERKLVFIDEVMFAYNTMQLSEYSCRGQNLILDKKIVKSKTLAVIAAISEEDGLEYYEVFNKSVDSKKFEQFL